MLEYSCAPETKSIRKPADFSEECCGFEFRVATQMLRAGENLESKSLTQSWNFREKYLLLYGAFNILIKYKKAGVL